MAALARGGGIGVRAGPPWAPGSELEHLRPTAVGETVTVAAALRHVDGRLLRFEVVVTDDADRLVGRAEVTRVVVDRSEFLGRARG